MSNRPQVKGLWYLAGPMTGIPQFNFPAFAEATATLRHQGFEILSPAEQDSPAVQAAALASPDGRLAHGEKIAGETWGDILSKDVKLVADKVIGLIYLPGWENSSGALLETTVAFLTKKAFRVYEDGFAAPVSTFWVFGQWASGVWRKIS